MYTRCPHCTTIFQVTAEQLRTAHGEIPCVTCAQEFNALESLSDDVKALISKPSMPDPEPSDDEIFDGADTEVDPDLEPDQPADEEDIGDQPLPDVPDSEPEPDDDEEQPTDESDDDEPDDDETAREEVLDEPDDEEDTRDQPLPDMSDSVPEPGDEEERPADEPDDDETAWEAAFDEPDSEGDTWDQPLPDLTDYGPKLDAVENQVDETDEPVNDEPPAESMEFNAPEQTWTRFFLTDGENVSPDRDQRKPVTDAKHEPWISDTENSTLEAQTEDPEEWQTFLTELGDDQSLAVEEADHQVTTGETDRSELNDTEIETDDDLYDDEFGADESSVIPPWLTDESSEELTAQKHFSLPSSRVLGACAALILLLSGQLLHYNRDALAANETYGTAVRGFYGILDATLYPDWPLDAFEVTGTEAIAGRSSQDALDILANVIVGGRQPVGLPLIRVILRDRWATPVASRVFEPGEYLRNFNPDHLLVNPGTALPIEISVADPGTEALGYVVDVCLPRRKTGLECQIARDPFQ